MNLLQHLLLKLNEESIEVATAVVALHVAKKDTGGRWNLADKAVDVDLEMNDLNAVIALLNEKFNFNYEIKSFSHSDSFLFEAVKLGFDYWIEKLQVACLNASKLSAKAIQFGLLERHEKLLENNLERIHKALDDIYKVIDILRLKFNLPYRPDDQKIKNKCAKISKYLDYSIHLGAVLIQPVPSDQYPQST